MGRKLTTIFAADIAQYSQHVEDDEIVTLTRLAKLSEIIYTLISTTCESDLGLINRGPPCASYGLDGNGSGDHRSRADGAPAPLRFCSKDQN